MLIIATQMGLTLAALISALMDQVVQALLGSTAVKELIRVIKKLISAPAVLMALVLPSLPQIKESPANTLEFGI